MKCPPPPSNPKNDEQQDFVNLSAEHTPPLLEGSSHF